MRIATRFHILAVLPLLAAPTALLAQAQTVQTPAAVAAAAAPARPPASAPAGYLLGPDDQLKISIFGQPDLSTETRIKADGTVLLALVGPVDAKGKTTSQLATDIAASYAGGGYLTKPSVSVDVSD
jgi:polysaccharide export outer membrane protein